ncbi:hypothetical protein CRUP_024530, partial [Coryphaenoides rupestris]
DSLVVVCQPPRPTAIRRTVSLDALVGPYLQGQWPKEAESPTITCAHDKATQRGGAVVVVVVVMMGTPSSSSFRPVWLTTRPSRHHRAPVRAGWPALVFVFHNTTPSPPPSPPPPPPPPLPQ